MSRRGTYLLGGVFAATATYYLYSAGGSPKAAEKRMESDAHRAAAQAKSRLPGRRSDDVENKMADVGARVGAQIGSIADEAPNKFDQSVRSANQNVRAFADEQRAAAREKINEADDKIQKKTSEAKNGIGSWLGIGGGSK